MVQGLGWGGAACAFPGCTSLEDGRIGEFHIRWAFARFDRLNGLLPAGVGNAAGGDRKDIATLLMTS